MTINDHVRSFAGLPVRPYEVGKGLPQAASAAWRVASTYDEPEDLDRLLSDLAAQPAAAQVRALVIGPWDFEGGDSAAVVASLTRLAPRLSGLQGLFLGDITVEEQEISWINQVDVGPMLRSFPGLREVVCRGGNDLRLSELRLPSLVSLTIQTGGMPRALFQDVLAAQVPALERLELWLGSDGYGREVGPVELAPLLSGKLFPRLSHLGICDAENIDDLTPGIATSPLLARLHSLDLSMGTLSDAGAAPLLAAAGIRRLQQLNLRHHYLSDAVQQQFRKLGIPVDLSDALDPEDDYRCAEVTE
jgi:hypothetical protein